MLCLSFIKASTFHERFTAPRHQFRYDVDYIALPMRSGWKDKWYFRRNRFSLFSFYDADHGPKATNKKNKQSPASIDLSENTCGWIETELNRHKLLKACDGEIVLLTQPRVLGSVFKPVSFWLCYDRGECLRAVLVEVNNTVKKRHVYVCYQADGEAIKAADHLVAEKLFYVSPFQKVEGQYKFSFDISKEDVAITIHYYSAHDELIFTATLAGSLQKLSFGEMSRCLYRTPIGGLRVFGLILWQALKLKIKGAAYSAPDQSGNLNA